MRYYLYRHVRLDKNEPFYIGVGTKSGKIQGWKTEYKRAFTRSKRSFMWINIARLTIYRVDILYESNSPQEIKKKEIEFIKIYGRKDRNLGPLVNNTDGGDGRLSPNKESLRNVGKNLELYREVRRRKVYRYDLLGNFIKEYVCLWDACIELKISSSSAIVACCKGKTRLYKGSMWFYEYKGIKICPVKERGKYHKPIGQFTVDTNMLVKQFESLGEAAEQTGINFKAISLCAHEYTKSSGGYRWDYL